MNLAVKYAGPLADFSGYGEANRNYVCALDAVGVDVTTEVFSYSTHHTNVFGESFRLAKELEGRDLKYDIKIVHVPCDSYLRFMEPCKYHIGHLFWETDRVSPEWVWNCNLMDEIWTGSEHNKKAFERSGVKRPIWVIPQAIDVEMGDQDFDDWQIPGHKGFLFYSVFQWIERKNPQALVKAFLKEFDKEDGVGLVIKTYMDKFAQPEKTGIMAQITDWRQEVGKRIGDPPIYLNVELMTKKDVFRLHKTGDCFVLPHRGEGWSLVVVEALLFGNSVISTNLGGVHDWLTKEVYYPLSYEKTNVFGMDFAPWYRKEQQWGDVSVEDLQRWMRHVYENQKEAAEIGKRGRQFVETNFSFEAVGERMKGRLTDIQKMINEEKEEGIRWLEW